MKEQAMKPLLNSLLITCGIAFVFASGCAAEDATAAPEPDLDSTEAAIGVCPATRTLALQRQRKAGEILAFLMGDDSKIPFVGASAENLVRTSASLARSALDLTDYQNKPLVLVTSQPSKQVCGVNAAFVRFAVNPTIDPVSVSFARFILIARLDMLADTAELYYPGIRPFLHNTVCPDGGVCTVDFDPEPAQFGAPLSGGTGAAASASYVNSGLPVSSVKWPTTYSNCSGNCPSPGLPCSSSNLAAGATVVGVFQRSTSNPSYYRCISQ
jgi:hypothetical protein